MEGRGFAIFQVLSVLYYCAFITVGMFSDLHHIQLNIKNDQNKLNTAPMHDSFTMSGIVNAKPKMLNANVA